MKKNLFLLISLAFFLTSICSAHPGRTDKDGGHHVSDTGEYHYHHGYEAHQHTGGTCPYNFDDRTGEDSNSSSGGSSSSSSDTKSSAWDNILYIIGLILLGPPMLFILFLFFVVPVLVPILKFIGKLDKKKKYLGKTRSEIAIMCGMPDSYFIDNDELPHEKGSTPSSDSLTVHIENHRRIYHSSPYCTYAPTKPINITQLHFCWACKKCRPPDIDITWYSSYLNAREYMRKHGIEPIPETPPAQLPPCKTPDVDE